MGAVGLYHYWLSMLVSLDVLFCWAASNWAIPELFVLFQSHTINWSNLSKVTCRAPTRVIWQTQTWESEGVSRDWSSHYSSLIKKLQICSGTENDKTFPVEFQYGGHSYEKQGVGLIYYNAIFSINKHCTFWQLPVDSPPITAGFIFILFFIWVEIYILLEHRRSTTSMVNFLFLFPNLFFGGKGWSVQ